jgi:hypothetical protein
MIFLRGKYEKGLSWHERSRQAGNQKRRYTMILGSAQRREYILPLIRLDGFVKDEKNLETTRVFLPHPELKGFIK